VACATDWRHKLHDEGCDLLDPSICLAKDPMITFRLSNAIGKLQRSGNPQLAAGLMVWVHTLRAMTRPELRTLGRAMWRELERGFPHVEEAALPCARNVSLSPETDCDRTLSFRGARERAAWPHYIPP